MAARGLKRDSRVLAGIDEITAAERPSITFATADFNSSLFVIMVFSFTLSFS
jgi:hypothetical protein